MTTFSKNRGLARTYIPSLLDLGLSATSALGLLRESGLGYRKTDFLSDWREFAGLEKKKDTFKYIPKRYKPTAATMTETSEMLSREYSYVFEVKGRDVITGEEKKLDWRYATDELISIEEAESLVPDWLEVPEYETKLKDYTVKLVGVKRRLRL